MIASVIVASTMAFWQPAGKKDPAVLYLVQPQHCTPQGCVPETILGGWNTQGKFYRPWDGKKWGPISPPPIAPPSPKEPEVPNFGLDKSWREIKDDFVDDSDKPRLTTVGLPKVALPKELADAVLFQQYPVGHWAVEGFAEFGKAPAIFLQAADGTIISSFESIPADKEIPEYVWNTFLADLKPKAPKPPPSDPVLPPPQPETPEPPLAPTPSPEIPNALLVIGGLILALFIWRRS
jgi:hypothetical protein